ncbi:MAG: AI-2E family transporter [Candidatus Woesearchaeota archaeon]
MRDELIKYSMIALLLVLIYLAYKTVAPILTYIFFSVIFVIVFKPLYNWLTKQTGMPRLSSFILVMGLILLIVIPSFFVASAIVREAPAFYQTAVETINFEQIDEFAARITGEEFSVQEELRKNAPAIQDFLIDNVGSMLGQLMIITLGLFVMFFTMFYLFTEGDKVLHELKRTLPLSEKHQGKLFKQTRDVIYATINGQIILGVIQGVAGAITLLLLGVPYAILWGFVMVVASILPIIGTYAVWIPIAIWLYAIGSTTQAIILLLVGFFIIGQLDNIFRPYVVSAQADIHPVTVIIGVFGGLLAFGVAGFIIGPLILGLFITILQFYSEEVAT